MGILNVTPDSFSDGGDNFASPIDGALKLLDEGADIIDIGGQSTRPNAELVGVAQELERVVPVVKELRKLRPSAIISVDTFNYEVAAVAIEAGANIINDVNATANNQQMYSLLARNPHVQYIMMHSRGVGSEMRSEDYGDDVVATVCAELLESVQQALTAGVSQDQIILDLGLGFSKATGPLNWPLVANLDRVKQLFAPLEFPILVAASRKRFLGELGSESPKERDIETATISVLSALQNAWGVRVHNVHNTVQALKVLQSVNQFRNQLDAPVASLRKVQVQLSGVSAFGVHGVNPDEKIYPQQFIVDIAYTLTVPIGYGYDDIKHTVSYSAVGKAVIAVIKEKHYDLIETLLSEIELAVKAVDSRIETVAITLHKPQAPLKFDFTDVTVQFGI